MKITGTLVLGTANLGKVAEFRELLSRWPCPLADLREFPNRVQVVEGGTTYADNARRKALQLARHLRQWVLADDTGLEVDALNAAPGIYTARFAGPKATAEANRARLLDRLRGVPWEDRSARFVCHLVLADPAGHVQAEAAGCCRGRIRCDTQGVHGFGYDSLFELVEYRLTLAELGMAATTCLSHRARAVRHLLPDLERLL